MSQVKVSGNASGTGIFTVAAPNSNSNYTLTLPANTGTLLTTASTGTVLQVVSTTKTAGASVSATTPTAISGLSATITPSSSSSKILIVVALNLSIDTNTKRIYFSISGGNAASYIGDAGTGVECAMSFCPRAGDAYMMLPGNMLYLDSPATTSSTTYQVNWWMEANIGYLNRPATIDANGANMASTITVMEIAG